MRKHFSDIFQAIINLLEDEKNIDDDNIDYYFINIDDDNIDYYFINIRIDQFVQEIRGLSNNNFRVYIYIYIYIYIYMNLIFCDR